METGQPSHYVGQRVADGGNRPVDEDGSGGEECQVVASHIEMDERGSRKNRPIRGSFHHGQRLSQPCFRRQTEAEEGGRVVFYFAPAGQVLAVAFQ